ncbi:putative killer cell immunoglobulin-like receptor-like protein KIR3DX1 [Heptranchias perlo]|uniref:putative killer cell immunoglobulin-like receptor-like protein KIR3DX1 n=1 Tax=Heptranchias perlo TaxID=212740 RepID=UPI00355A77D1
MDTTVFLLLFVSFVKPTLSMDPAWSVILLGEEVSLTCHFAHSKCIVDFYRNNEKTKNKMFAYFNEVNYTAKTKDDGGLKVKGSISYRCKYKKYFENNSSWAYSPPSDNVWLNLTDKLPKPTVSMDPAAGVVTVGERVRINCTANYSADRSRLYRQGDTNPIDTRDVSGSERSIIFNITDPDPTDGGAYICDFVKTVKEKEYISPRSDPVHLTVKDKLPKPTVSMDPAAGVVTVGERVRINCTASYSADRSRFYRQGNENPIDTREVSGSERSIMFNITDPDPTDGGDYTCDFVKTVKEKEYISPRSDPVHLIVKEIPVVKPPTPKNQSWRKGWLIKIVAGCAAVITVILLLGLAWFCLHKKNAVASRSGHNDPNAAEPDVVYASLRTAALNRGGIARSLKAATPTANPDACVYAVMKIRSGLREEDPPDGE